MDKFERKYEPYTIAAPVVEEIRKAFPAYETMLLSILQYIIRTYSNDPAYHFLNTKIDTISGEGLHYVLGKTDIFGKETIYSWIQGRGLEAIGGHLLWLGTLNTLTLEEKGYFQTKCMDIVREASCQLNSFRKKNNGRLSFWMDMDGNAFRLGKNNQKKIISLSPGEVNYSDLFAAKGLIMSAYMLEDKQLETEIRNYYTTIIDGIKKNRFRTDQEQFDPKNKVAFEQGKISHAPKMIALGMCTLFCGLYDDKQYIDDGLYLIDEIFSRYVNYDMKFPTLQKYDMPEFIAPDGTPFCDEGHVVSFPGHVMEVIGFTGKFFHTIKNRSGITKRQRADIEKISSFLADFFVHNFRLGLKKGYGMYKSVSLDTRKPLNSDMPWWALPETIRAATYVYNIAKEGRKKEILSFLAETSNVFLNRYINTDVHCMAYQTLDELGNPICTIPATPDADPGYHTGLSIIDFMENLTSLPSGLWGSLLAFKLKVGLPISLNAHKHCFVLPLIVI